MHDFLCEPPDAYHALDGSVVAIPPLLPLADGPMPVFGPADEVWLDKLIAFREQFIRRDQHMVQHAERKSACDADFGADGRGFLDALNNGLAENGFWQGLRTLMYQRIPVLKFHAPEIQIILRDVLSRFPERVWLPLIAEVCLPHREHRKSDHLNELMDQFIAGERADFRHLERGAAKPETEDDLSPDMRKAILRDAFLWISAFSAFKETTLTIDAAGELKGTANGLKELRELTEQLRETASEEITDAQADLIEELLREMTLARTYEEGQTKAEINLGISSAYESVMRAATAGRTKGFFIRSMLSKRPSGFTALNLKHYPRQMVWPYLASHLDILDRAMGIAGPFYFEPHYERAKAIELIALLPKVPRRYAEALFEVATGPHKGGRKTAQLLLTGVTQFTEAACASLSDRKADVRRAAADTLSALGDPAALPALHEQASRERSKSARSAIENAIAALSQSAAGAIDIDGLCEQAAREELDLPATCAWLADLAPPPLVFRDNRPVPEAVALWLVTVAARHGEPLATARIDEHLKTLATEARAILGSWVLREWVAYDTQPWPEEKIDDAHQNAAKELYRTYVMFWDVRDQICGDSPEYQGNQMMRFEDWCRLKRDDIAKRAGYYINTAPYQFSAQDARGVLGIARHAPPEHLVNAIRSYLANHGRRTAQCKALLECLASTQSDFAHAFLKKVSQEQRQKTLRGHATELLRARS